MNRPRRKKDSPTKSNKRLIRYSTQKLPPLPEQEERIRMIKKRRILPTLKIHLTKKQRRYSWNGGLTGKKYDGPKNYRVYRL